MSRIAILHPTSLLGKELVEHLDRHPELQPELRLLSVDEEEIGQLTEASGAAALVAAADRDEIAAADVLVVAGEVDPYREALAHRRDDSTVVLVAPRPQGADAAPSPGEAPQGRQAPRSGADDLAGGTPVVAGLNLAAARPGEVLVSPHAGSILLSLLLAPLVKGPVAAEGSLSKAGPGVGRAVATVVQPVSIYDRPGLDELFAQAGRMVAMQSQEPSELFGQRQLAFNLYPAPRPPRHLPAEVRAVLGDAAPPLSAHVLQGPVFHGFSALLHVSLDQAMDAEDLRRRLGLHELVELYRPRTGAREQLGLIDVPASDHVLVGSVQADPESENGFWIWSVMDNLTRGGALHVLAILERVAGR